MDTMKTLLHLKVDKEAKEHAQKIAQELGLSLSAVINIYLRQFIRSRALYISDIPRITPELERLLGRIEKDIPEKKNMSLVFSSAEAMDEYLDAL